MRCRHCNTFTTAPLHHVIFKSQGGTDHEKNLIQLCELCHYEIHHGKNTEKKEDILKTCYSYIRHNLPLCWSGKIKPKIINLIEQGEY